MQNKKWLDRLTQEELYELFLKVSERITNETLEELGENKGRVVPFADYDAISEELLKDPEAVHGISGGYSEIDQITRGFEPGELIIVGAETGVGKSLIVQNMFRNIAARGIPNLFVSLEMPNGEADKRYKEMQMDATGVKDFREQIRKFPLYAYEADPVTLDGLDEAIGKAIADYGIKIVGIDHLHYFAKASDNASGEIGQIVRRVKLMARKHNIPIFLISHLKKLTKPGTMPHLNDLRDSSFIAQDADCVMMLSRKTLSENEVERKTLNWEIQKNRTRGHLGSGRLDITSHYKISEVNQ